MSITPRPGKALLALALALQLISGAVFVARTPVTIDGTRYFTLFDDAMISMRYARNLANGHGLVWNAGDAPVEGYTNFLWTLYMAALHRAAGEQVVPLLVALTGLAVLLANLFVVWAIARRLAPDLPKAAPAAVLMVVCFYSLGYWTLRGMEVGLLALAIDAAVLGVLLVEAGGSGALLACALTLLPLIRADGAVPALLIAAYACFSLGGRSIRAWTFLALPFAAIAAHTGFRVWYYGEWMPNTYYLKMTGAPMALRLRRGLLSTALEGAWALWPIALLAAASRPLTSHRRLLTVIASSVAAYSVYVGADAWEWTGHVNRYLVCAAPPALILAAIGMARLASLTPVEGPRPWFVAVLSAAGVGAYVVAAVRFFPEPELSVARPFLLSAVGLCALGAAWSYASRRRLFVALAVTTVVLVTSGAKMLEWIRYNDLHVVDDRYSTELGVRLGQFTEPDARIAVVTAGAIPYFSHRWTADLLGKNDAHIAHLPSHLPLYPGHDKWDYRYSVDRWRPDVIVQLWRPSVEEVAYVISQGYVDHPSGIFVRRDSRLVDGERLLAAVDDLERRHAAARRRP